MKTIQVYDLPMCCPTGLCGTEIDPALVSFAALLTQLGQKGVKVERYNLGQQPMAFVQNAAVKALLDKEGVEVLPLIFVDGEVRVKGRYLTDTERETLSSAARTSSRLRGSSTKACSRAVRAIRCCNAARKRSIVTCAKWWRNNPTAPPGCRGRRRIPPVPRRWPNSRQRLCTLQIYDNLRL